MITRQQVDALNYGDIVRLEIDGEVLEGPVEGQNGYKHVNGRSLRLSDFSRGMIQDLGMYEYIYDPWGSYRAVYRPRYETSTGYPEYVLANGTLTFLYRAGSEYGAAYVRAMRRFDEAIERLNV